ncbi:Cyclin-P3-1 [Acorus calamus]|uniref:Cyclin-P3-1 n=1 Tax=Acorus calamus TaxID=4465 RepID=A0AAV9EU30_ACOCL|nr:Cyclin-P3-1 [Acorus calamus]
MGSLAQDVDDLATELYLTLGLKESSKKISENPRILSILSSLLERSVQKNEKLEESTNKKAAATIFHGLRVPSLSIQQYMDRIFKYSGCSPSCFVLAHIYMDRFLQQPGSCLTSLNVHRLLITSVVVAAKFIDDAFYNNAYYAKVGGVTTGEMNRLELKFLFSLDFRLQVNVGTFGKYCLQLEKEANGGGYQIERSIRVCGLDGWTGNEESKGQLACQRYSCGTV